MQNILIIGAASAIAEATARLFAAQGANMFLMARSQERLSGIAGDLKVRGAGSVRTASLDANDIDAHQAALDAAYTSMGRFDVVLVAYGTLGDQKKCEADPDEALRELQTNAMSTVSLLSRLANIMERQGSGTLAVISSVAGDRGRPANYVYGASKAAVTAFCEGLRSRLYRKGVHVLTVKPGMVDSPMTEGMELPAALLAKPEEVARDIVEAIRRKQDVLYTPWYWRFVMMGIIHLPVKVFKRLSL
ncbi:MAG: SDR family oxidoreductase [Chlorobiaceae bacterium]|nr:SDR family oxidoreductase [Chlorobiaceae bacterium]